MIILLMKIMIVNYIYQMSFCVKKPMSLSNTVENIKNVT